MGLHLCYCFVTCMVYANQHSGLSLESPVVSDTPDRISYSDASAKKKRKRNKNVSGKNHQIGLDSNRCSRFCSFNGCHVLLENTHSVHYNCIDGYRNSHYRLDHSVQTDHHIRLCKHFALVWMSDFQSFIFHTGFCPRIFTDDGNPRAYFKLQKP